MYVRTLLLCCFWHTPPYYNILENHVVAHSRWATNSLLFLPCKVGSNSPSLWIWAAFSDMFLLFIYILWSSVCKMEIFLLLSLFFLNDRAYWKSHIWTSFTLFFWFVRSFFTSNSKHFNSNGTVMFLFLIRFPGIWPTM